MKHRIVILIVGLIFCFGKGYAQESDNITDSTVYILVDSLPVLIVNDKLYKIQNIKEFINENLKYPANDVDCVGRVYISFIIEKDGTVSNKKYIRKLCPGFDENAMDVIDLMRKWKPGLKDGYPVRTQLTFPISFVLY